MEDDADVNIAEPLGGKGPLSVWLVSSPLICAKPVMERRGISDFQGVRLPIFIADAGWVPPAPVSARSPQTAIRTNACMYPTLSSSLRERQCLRSRHFRSQQCGRRGAPSKAGAQTQTRCGR